MINSHNNIKNFLKINFEIIILIITFIILGISFGFSIFFLYHFINLQKINNTETKKFEINQSLYQEISQKLDEKNKINEKIINKKIESIKDPFEKI